MFGEMTDLNKIASKVEKKLWIKIYAVPAEAKEGEENCFPESHGVCRFDYYLAVSEFDEYPAYNVFNLGQFGEIGGYQWMKSEALDQAKIKVIVKNYPEMATKFNSNLKNSNKAQILRSEEHTSELQSL